MALQESCHRVGDEKVPASSPAKTRPLLSSGKRHSVEQKSPLAYVLIVGIWVSVVITSLPVFFRALNAASGPVHVTLLVILEATLAVFWLFGIYNIVVTVLGYFRPLLVTRGPYEPFRDSPVAIVYPTYNDFSAQHLDASREQTHSNTHTYIVDDSTDESVIAEIDAYGSTRDGITVVRRQGRKGFKGGAINNALETVITEPYFVLMDADEVLPPNFVEQAFTYLTGDEVGFVQANHNYNRAAATRFGRDLGIGVDIHWDVYQRIRNHYGFVMLLGHGALIRRDVWAEIGGFPEIVSEDLAFATRAREWGYFGVFAEEIDCLEDFPVDYTAFKKRHKKWTAGSIEYIREQLPRFLRHEEPSVVEKLDVLIPVMQLPLTVMFVMYILTVGMLEITYGGVLPATVHIPIHLGVVTVATLLSPLYCYIIGLRHRLVKLLRFCALSTTVYTSVAVTAVIHTFTVILGRRAVFLTTPKQTTTDVCYREYVPTIAFGILTFALALHIGLLVGAVALAWILAPFLASFNDDRLRGRVIRTLCVLPAVLLCLGLFAGFHAIFFTDISI